MQRFRLINIDIELKSKKSLAPLIAFWDEDVCVLRDDFDGEEHHLSFEVSAYYEYIEGEFAAEQFIIDEVYRLVSILSVKNRALWDNCTAKVLDFGYEQHLDLMALNSLPDNAVKVDNGITYNQSIGLYGMRLPNQILSILTSLDVDLFFTFYPIHGIAK
ncbi:hypothetical protein [uncultured Shewanella sp.]|uniref:hypothetical protein n=1 Tax=uncultured Shewanella sp. TaxID=173975 RepID=UPI00260DA95D|nr:hypothetical protein [uncultured Shewanella sp.]